MSEIPTFHEEKTDPVIIESALDSIRALVDDPTMPVETIYELLELDPDIAKAVDHILENEESK